MSILDGITQAVHHWRWDNANPDRDLDIKEILL